VVKILLAVFFVVRDATLIALIMHDRVGWWITPAANSPYAAFGVGAQRFTDFSQ